jgi:hypothetical protein
MDSEVLSPLGQWRSSYPSSTYRGCWQVAGWCSCCCTAAPGGGRIGEASQGDQPRPGAGGDGRNRPRDRDAAH